MRPYLIACSPSPAQRSGLADSDRRRRSAFPLACAFAALSQVSTLCVMSLRPRTVVCAGAASGLGLEAIRQLLCEPAHAFRIFLGCRRAAERRASLLRGLTPLLRDGSSISVLELDLCSQTGVEAFARGVIEEVGDDGIDVLVLNAAIVHRPRPDERDRLSAEYVVNCLSQHALVFLLRDTLNGAGPRRSRVVFVGSELHHKLRTVGASAQWMTLTAYRRAR